MRRRAGGSNPSWCTRCCRPSSTANGVCTTTRSVAWSRPIGARAARVRRAPSTRQGASGTTSRTSAPSSTTIASACPSSGPTTTSAACSTRCARDRLPATGCAYCTVCSSLTVQSEHEYVLDDTRMQVNDTVYLVVLGAPHVYYGKCCTFKRPWHVFRPWVTSPMHYSHAAPLNGSAADWWEFKYQDVAPFMWGFYRNRTAGYVRSAPTSYSYCFRTQVSVHYSMGSWSGAQRLPVAGGVHVSGQRGVGRAGL